MKCIEKLNSIFFVVDIIQFYQKKKIQRSNNDRPKKWFFGGFYIHNLNVSKKKLMNKDTELYFDSLNNKCTWCCIRILKTKSSFSDFFSTKKPISEGKLQS